MNDNIAIKVEHLSKMYRLGTINNGTLWKDIQTWTALKLGKEDPHSKIGEDKYSGDKDHFWALKNIDFEIQQGDRVGIIGKNGAGKSTLLKLLSRVTSPSEGTIKIKGKIASLLEVGTGFNGELTGRENIYLNGAILGMKKKQIDRKIDEIIDFSGIEHHIDTPVKRYSSGMYVRLAFAVAAHLDSEILIADEVLAVGDADFQKKALGKMQDLSTGQGRTVLFVSHQMNAVKSLCNKGILLSNGRIVFKGNLDNTVKKYLGTDPKYDLEWNANNIKQQPKHTLKILEFYFTDANNHKINRDIDNNEKIYVNIVFNYFVFNSNLTFGLTVFNNSNDNLFRTLVTDLNDDIINQFKIGINHLICELPVDILKTGTYLCKIDASIHLQEWIINPYEDNNYTLGFNISNSLFSSKQMTISLISPKVNWTIQKSDR